MNQDTTIKYLETNTDPADGTQAKDKWGQYTGWTRTYKDGEDVYKRQVQNQLGNELAVTQQELHDVSQDGFQFLDVYKRQQRGCAVRLNINVDFHK